MRRVRPWLFQSNLTVPVAEIQFLKLPLTAVIMFPVPLTSDADPDLTQSLEDA